ncbi:formate dehydrogenase accessory sulfurtransferase FdhD [Paludibacterium yongneupense]|uniref:formate dehydrogenase accessory sulfurtransferase FdhD n=1 Tax=Paludibacterium yongneupense TaxID=400061 RepID=UPI00048A8832|nr:formate dehydrogenase accessory sulfurtransferase FdhD [Paludibacterium yongneupense]
MSQPDDLASGLARCIERGGWRQGEMQASRADWLAEEVPVALVYNGLAHVVMMCTPHQLDDFARGFSLSEGIARQASDLYDVDVRPVANGVEVHIELAGECFARLKERRRQMAGRTGCGLCGVEQLEQVARPAPPVGRTAHLSAPELQTALAQLAARQPLAAATGATHAAAWIVGGQLALVREDVGRHVALDKLIGAMAREPQGTGALLVTSRASFEMVQKAAHAGFEILAAVSAPTAMALDMARQCDVTLLGFVRPGRVNVYYDCGRFAGS